jgi:hypothetical protein
MVSSQFLGTDNFDLNRYIATQAGEKVLDTLSQIRLAGLAYEY